MNEQPWMAGAPTGVLLATDLSARCDRAFDRAAQLAGEWNAELVALNVLEAPKAPDQVLSWAAGDDDASLQQIAQQQLREAVADLDIRTRIQVSRGDTASTVNTLATSTGCGVIVAGMARSEPLGRFLVGSVVERLARTASQPLLVVRNRARRPYRRIVIASDFSDSSRHALHAAARFFPDRQLTLYHAHSQPLPDRTDKEAGARLSREVERGECADFLAGSDLPEDVRNRLQVVVERGRLATTLTRFVRDHGTDLVIMGTHGRSGLMDVLLGSTAVQLLDWLPCDTMIVREPRASR